MTLVDQYHVEKEKKVSEKGFKGFSGGKGFTTLQKTLASYHGGFLGKRFSKVFQFHILTVT